MTADDRPKDRPKDRRNVTIALVTGETSTLAEYRASEPDLDPATLAIVDELLEKGRATLHPTWAAAAGAGAGEPDRGDGYPV